MITVDANKATRIDILKQITALEQQVTPRRQREAILGIDEGWLANIEQQIQTLRTQLK